MRTPEEIKRQIAGLTAMRARLPQISFFGDDSHASIDAQLTIIQGDADTEDYVDGEDDNDVYINALDASLWLNGERDEDLFDKEDAPDEF